jgi:hypothetical protein
MNCVMYLCLQIFIKHIFVFLFCQYPIMKVKFKKIKTYDRKKLTDNLLRNKLYQNTIPQAEVPIDLQIYKLAKMLIKYGVF